MLKAGALYYAVAVSLLIGLVSASLIMLAYQQRIQSGQLMIYDRLINNAHSGLQLMLIEPRGNGSSPVEISLFDNGDDSVATWQAQWGAFNCHFAKAHSGQFHHTKAAIAGGSTGKLPTIYLADMGRPLSLSGKTLIKGDAMLPAAGAKRAYIEGKSFVGTKLVDGTIGTSEKQLPPLVDKLGGISKAMTASQFTIVAVADGGAVKDSFFVSFIDTARLLAHNGPITVQGNAWLKGKIVVRSPISITVNSGAGLEDVILQAPVIIIESGFKGTLQAIATDSIVVASNADLKYPSALILETEAGKSTPSYIKLESNSKVSGLILVSQPSAKTPGASVYIATDALMEGVVYVGGKVSLQGKIAGSLYCREFYLRTPSSVYENYLLDGVIDKAALHPLWQQPILLKDQTVEGYIKWLY